MGSQYDNVRTKDLNRCPIHDYALNGAGVEARGPVAQLEERPACDGDGCEFKSRQGHFTQPAADYVNGLAKANELS